MYEFTGKVKSVGELQTFASGFTKRELVVEEERDGNGRTLWRSRSRRRMPPSSTA